MEEITQASKVYLGWLYDQKTIDLLVKDAEAVSDSEPVKDGSKGCFAPSNTVTSPTTA